MSAAHLTWLDGAPATALPLPDRGFSFGDGLFETLLIRGGRALFLDLHLLRFQYGCARLFLPDCTDRLQRDILAFCASLPPEHHWAALRATVTRGAGPRGYAPPPEPAPRIVLEATPLARDCLVQLPPARLVEAQHTVPLQPSLAGIKHLNRLDQVLIAREARSAAADDALVYDSAGRLVSSGNANVFLVIGGELHTPLLEDAGITGTRRQLVCHEWASALGLDVRIGVLDRGHVQRSAALFLTNSLVGVRAVGQLGERTFEDHSIARRLFAEYARSCG